MLDTLIARPDDLRRADLDRARDAGVSEVALRDAIDVCVIFHVMIRLADALDFALIPPERKASTAARLAKSGYRLPGFI